MGPTVIVVDTNFVIDQLQIVQDIIAQGPQFNHVVVVPSMVLEELDRLKTRGGDLASRARRANDRIFEILANNHPGLAGQRPEQRIERILKGDDAIIDCARYFAERGYLVVLLSNDRNICARALISSIKSVTWRPGVTAEQIVYKIFEEAQHFASVGGGPVEPMESPVFQPEPEHNEKVHAPRRSSHSASRYSNKSPQAEAQAAALGLVEAGPPAGQDYDMEDEPEEVPLVQIPYNQFTDLGSIERAIKATLFTNAKRLVFTVLKDHLTSAQVAALEDPELSLRVFADFCSSESVLKYLPATMASAFMDETYPVQPTTKQAFRDFILFWGSFCICIYDIAAVRDMCAGVSYAYEQFYARPGEAVQGPPSWITAQGGVWRAFKKAKTGRTSEAARLYIGQPEGHRSGRQGGHQGGQTGPSGGPSGYKGSSLESMHATR